MLEQAPISKVLLSIEKTFQDEIVTESGLKFYFDGSYQKNWSATVTAKVEALPINPKNNKIIERLKVGDEVAVSYQIVGDISFGSDRDRFMECVEPNNYVKDYRNGIGDRLSVYALPKRSGFTDVPIWVGLVQNKFREVISGVQGSEEEVSRWQSQFKFGKTDDYTFDNFFEYQRKDYWQCASEQIFAKKVKGHLVAIGDRVICIPIDAEVPDQMLIGEHRGHKVKLRFTDRARVLSSPNKKFKKDEIVSFLPQKCERYNFFGKDYYLIREDLVIGKWHVANGNKDNTGRKQPSPLHLS